MGFIFESEIVTIINTVRARTIGESETIEVKDILLADAHPAIKAYFKAEVEKMLQQERVKEIRSKRFPYALPEVAGLQRQIDLLLVNHYQFGQGDFETLLDEAVHFEFNYLCRPQWTLQSFMFENKRSIPVSEALRKFKYCVDYTYFGELYRRYVIDRGLAEVSFEEFRSLIEKIDREIVAAHSSRELANLLKPLLHFIEAGIPETRISETGPVLPINAAVVFFEDKKLPDLQLELERRRDKEGVTEVSIQDLAELIAAVRQEPVIEPMPAQEKPTEVMPERHEPSKPQVVKPRETMTAEFKKKPVREALKLLDVYSLFTVKEQKLFVKKIFQKDEIGFRNALDRLNPVSSWNEASMILDEIFRANNIDPTSKAAIQLTDKVFSRYKATGTGNS